MRNFPPLNLVEVVHKLLLNPSVLLLVSSLALVIDNVRFTQGLQLQPTQFNIANFLSQVAIEIQLEIQSQNHVGLSSMPRIGAWYLSFSCQYIDLLMLINMPLWNMVEPTTQSLFDCLQNHTYQYNFVSNYMFLFLLQNASLYGT